MSKYMTKGNKGAVVHDDLLPSSWWSMSDSLQKKVGEFERVIWHEFKSAQAAREAYTTLLQEMDSRGGRNYDMIHPFNHRKIGKVSYVGKQDATAFFDELRDLLLSEAARLSRVTPGYGTKRTLCLATKPEDEPKFYLWRE